MRRLVFAVIMAVLLSMPLLFVYANLDESTFAYRVILKFNIPVVMEKGWMTVPIPLGFLLIITFCLGMIALPLLEAIPSLYKALEIRSKNKKIRELERELNVSRQLAGVDRGSSREYD